MNIKISPFLKDLIATTLTSVATVLSFIFVTRILADGLGPEGFGSYSMARRILATLEPLSTFTMGIAVTRFVAINREDRYGYFFSGLLFGICSSAFLLALAFIFRDPLTMLFFQDRAYAPLLVATFYLIFGYSCFVILYGFYRGTGKVWEANIWQLALVAIVPLIIAMKYAYSAKADFIIFLHAVSFTSIVVPISYYLIRSLSHNRTPVIKWAHIKELFHYGFFRIPGLFAYGGILAIAIFISPYMGTLENAGYLAIGLSVIRAAEGGIDSFGRVILPRAAQFFALGQKVLLKERIVDMTNFIVHMGSYVTLHIILWSNRVIPIWLGGQYSKAVQPVNIFSIAIIPFLMYSMLRVIIDATEVRAINAHNLYISFLATVFACLIFAALGLGVLGLAAGTVLGIFVLGALTLRYLCVSFQIGSFDTKIGECLLLNAIFMAAGYLIKISIVKLYPSGLGLLVAVLVIETGLFAIYCAALNRLNVSWITEIKKRIAIGKYER